VEFNNQRSKLVFLGIKIGNRHIQHFRYSADSILIWLMIEAKEIWLSRYFFWVKKEKNRQKAEVLNELIVL
jgi:hypothetical protein